MDELLTKMAPNAVSAVAVIVVVIYFLKYLASTEKAFLMRQSETQAAYQKQMDGFQDRYERHTMEMNGRFDRISQQTADALGKMAEALMSNGETLKNIEQGFSASPRRRYQDQGAHGREHDNG